MDSHASHATEAIRVRWPRRALLAIAIWTLAVAPGLLSVQRCTIARVFHRPCPGCGMTRAMELLLLGDWRGSLHMHPLAVPMVIAGGAFAAATVWTTYSRGYPLVHESRAGKAAIALLGATYVACIALWVLRWCGYFGGPVPVY